MKMKILGFLILTVVVFIGCSSDSKTLSVSPSKADFDDVYLGDSVDIVLTLKNKYDKDISITNLIINGPGDYSITGSVSMPLDLLKGEEYNLTITFTPSTDGLIEGVLVIRHTGATKDKEINLTGNGVRVARIKLSESSYDYQKKIVGKNHTHNFEIENIGTSVLDITDMTFSGLGASSYSVTAGDAPVNIQPSAKHTFTVTFAPSAAGNYPAILSITHNAVNESVPFNMQFDGEGVVADPRITLSVGSSWDFGSVAKTLPAVLVCEIENTGIDPLNVTSATLTTNAEFQIESLKDSNGNTLNFPQQVAVGAKIFLAVKFTPTANQQYNDKLTFVHDGTNAVSPLEIPITGLGRNEVSKTFVYTGAPEQWTVPNGVSFIVVECYGAQGGDSGNNAFGANGGMAKAKVPVTPGETVYIFVGGKGTTLASGATGGWNGGGGTASTSSQPAGSGGGASDIRVGGQALSDRKVIGAGGGGGGFQGTVANGGAGGGLTGDNGSQWSSYPPGEGATQSIGGKGGDGSTWGQPSATSGSLGLGGRGQGWSGGGGGGGGGLYGGGGGFISGGGGGSSYYDAAGNTDKSTQKGIKTGNGEIKITY